jgi:hypothetical protein
MASYLMGPFLTAALFCEEARQDKDGFLSLSRIIDHIVILGDDPNTMPPTQVVTTLVVIFRSGSFRGSSEITVSQLSASGASVLLFSFPTFFQGDDQGAGVIARVGFVISEPGLHWFEVSLGGQPKTRIPLNVSYAVRG